MITLRFGSEDVVRCRFARSPLWETVAAVRTLAQPRRRAQHAPWAAGLPRDPDEVGLRLLVDLQPGRGYVPDFLTPPPERAAASFASELARVRRTPLDRVRAELERSFAERPPSERPFYAQDLVADVAGTLARVVEALARAWALLLEPYWPRIRDLLADDVRHHAQLLADGGLERLFAELHPTVRRRDGRLEVETRVDDARDLGGAGLVLMPSVFTWPDVVVILDEPWQPTLVYPARGVERLWSDPPAAPAGALARLLGRSRAALLVDLAAPATTTALARRHSLEPSTVSGHLRALRDTGLASGSRRGNEVVYQRTKLGDALCDQPPRR